MVVLVAYPQRKQGRWEYSLGSCFCLVALMPGTKIDLALDERSCSSPLSREDRGDGATVTENASVDT